MASTKEYGYYIEGNKIAIVQRDTSFDNDANSRDYGPGSDKFQWKSPLESIDKGIEFQYSYSPDYKEVNTSSRQSRSPNGLLSYKATSATGKLELVFDNDVNFGSNAGSYILLINAGKWNGIHYITAGGVNQIVTNTNYTDGGKLGDAIISFESDIAYNLAILVMVDETYEVDLPIYLQKALIYYMKMRLYEDVGDMKLREYFKKEFLKQTEKHNNGRIPGVRIASPGWTAIK